MNLNLNALGSLLGGLDMSKKENRIHVDNSTNIAIDKLEIHLNLQVPDTDKAVELAKELPSAAIVHETETPPLPEND